MLAKADAAASEYWSEMMKEHIDYCRERVAPGYTSTAPEPVAVAAAIEHALFADTPKDHYLVVPNKGTSGSITWSLVADLLDLKTDAEFGFSREEIIDILDREIAFRAGDESAWDDLREAD